MRSLRSNSILLLLLCFVSACQSAKVFELKTFHTSADDLHVIHVNSNRLRQKCLFLDAEAENNWRHQYLMYILDDQNEVLEIMESINQDIDSCNSQVHQIEKLLQSEPQVKVCVRNTLAKNTKDSWSRHEPIQFGSLGSHRVSYGTLTLDSVCSSNKCYGDNSAWVNTCPGFTKH